MRSAPLTSRETGTSQPHRTGGSGRYTQKRPVVTDVPQVLGERRVDPVDAAGARRGSGPSRWSGRVPPGRRAGAGRDRPGRTPGPAPRSGRARSGGPAPGASSWRPPASSISGSSRPGAPCRRRGRVCVEHLVGSGVRIRTPTSCVAVISLAGGGQQGGEVVQALRVGYLGGHPAPGQRPDLAGAPELRRRSGRSTAARPRSPPTRSVPPAGKVPWARRTARARSAPPDAGRPRRSGRRSRGRVRRCASAASGRPAAGASRPRNTRRGTQRPPRRRRCRSPRRRRAAGLRRGRRHRSSAPGGQRRLGAHRQSGQRPPPVPRPLRRRGRAAQDRGRPARAGRRRGRGTPASRGFELRGCDRAGAATPGRPPRPARDRASATAISWVARTPSRHGWPIIAARSSARSRRRAACPRSPRRSATIASRDPTRNCWRGGQPVVVGVPGQIAQGDLEPGVAQVHLGRRTGRTSPRTPAPGRSAPAAVAICSASVSRRAAEPGVQPTSWAANRQNASVAGSSAVRAASTASIDQRRGPVPVPVDPIGRLARQRGQHPRVVGGGRGVP